MELGITSDDILRAIQGAMKELFDLDATRVQPSARLVEDLGLDSVEALDLLAKMEETTGHAFAETKLRKLRTVGDVVAAIQAVTSGSARADRVRA
jgi:acyl carrier protein